MADLPPLPAYTPYDGSSKLFAIGLKPLDLDEWIDVGADFDHQLREKRRLYAKNPERVLVEEPETRDAQREVLDLLRVHLPRRFPQKYRQDCKGLAIVGHPALTTEQIENLPPLKAASLLVQEDLILMRRGDEGWRLAAGSLCFPSHWDLLEKFGRPLQDIHAPVPEFGRGTRNADLIHRMFDNLSPARSVERMNWSLQADALLFKPFSSEQREERATSRPLRFPGDDPVAQAFIRVERQTLRKLPTSGDILFTIRIHLDPMAVLRRHPERRRIAAGFAEQLSALDVAQLDYKGFTADRDRLVLALRDIASS